jgi:hypothetical protein
MSSKTVNPFYSIESAHEFVALLAETVVEAKRDIESDIQSEMDSEFPRRLEALRIALLNLEKLEFHMNKSRRILNDLRSLRRLLLKERTASPETGDVEDSRIEAASGALPTRVRR